MFRGCAGAMAVSRSTSRLGGPRPVKASTSSAGARLSAGTTIKTAYRLQDYPIAYPNPNPNPITTTTATAMVFVV